ncbi:MAG: hypothetical protein ACL93V_05265 [Candidatus Electrothrix sp. YB6]
MVGLKLAVEILQSGNHGAEFPEQFELVRRLKGTVCRSTTQFGIAGAV